GRTLLPRCSARRASRPPERRLARETLTPCITSRTGRSALKERVLGTHHSSLLASRAARSRSSRGSRSASEDGSHWGLRCFSEEVLRAQRSAGAYPEPLKRKVRSGCRVEHP